DTQPARVRRHRTDVTQRHSCVFPRQNARSTRENGFSTPYERSTIRVAGCQGETRVHAALTRARHINHSLDGEIPNGNCEKGSREEGGSKEGPGEKGRGQEGAGEEGRTGEEGPGEEGRGQEGPREEGAGQEAHSQRRLHEGDDPERRAGRHHW